MPTYEYECGSCNHRFERFQPMTAGLTLSCPRCQKRARRLISLGGGLLFKGAGFYITDYRSASYKERAKQDSRPKAESTPSGKTEKKREK